MDSFTLFAYCLIIVGVMVWVAFLPSGKRLSPKVTNYINIFGGAFLFASCFINLVPHMFLGEGDARFVTPNLHFKVAAAVMVGFLIQLLLEQLTRGAEHGHNHCPCCEESVEAAEHHHEHLHHEGHCHDDRHHPMTGLILGLSIHAFLEGMPLVDLDGDVHQGLLYGIVLHNIPIALVLVSLFINNRYGFWKSFLLLAIFAVMTPLGSLCNLYLLPDNEVLQSLIMGVVVGILAALLWDYDEETRKPLPFSIHDVAMACLWHGMAGVVGEEKYGQRELTTDQLISCLYEAEQRGRNEQRA